MKTLNAKNLIGALVIACASLFTANAANASCYTGWTNVVEVYENSINGVTYGYIYAIPEHTVLPSYLYYFYTTNQTALIQAKLAIQNHEPMYFWADIAACPTTGSYRYIGTLQGLYDY
jgi:hypothetical protein